MRPIFNQQGACCSQAAGVGYVFTYEINRLRNQAANNIAYDQNWYPTHYTWNFLNRGTGTGSEIFEGWDIIKENGCPNVEIWGGMAGDMKRWMSGYNNYQSTESNKIDTYWHINISTPSGLNVLKHWLNDHNEGGNAVGGLAAFGMFMGGIDYDLLPAGTPDAGEGIIAYWNSSIVNPHSMTFVGYNDNIKYDINNDGQYSNTSDNNGDGVINMEDWEIGALIIANSHGLTYPSIETDPDGFIYFPYRLLATEDAIQDHIVYVLEAKQNYNQKIAIEAEVDYDCREKIEFRVGYANKANELNTFEQTEYSSFKYFQGGCFPLQGINYDPIKVSLDFGHWYLNNDFGKIYFIVFENENGNPSSGTINNFSIVDYRWNEEFELPCLQTNVPIENNTETILYVDYDLIPHENNIEANLLFDSDMVSRFDPEVSNGAELSIANGVKVDMYNGSTITIDGSSSLLIGNNVQFNAKSGNCELIIDGDVSFGENLSFFAEENASLKISINNTSAIALFDAAIFENCNIESHAQELSFEACNFANCDDISSFRGDVSISDGSEFIESFVNIINSGKNDDEVLIVNSIFKTNSDVNDAINIDSYQNIFVHYNTIENNGQLNSGPQKGLYIRNSGGGSAFSTISSNEISDCAEAGLVVYDSDVEIFDNYIHNNEIGLKLLNNSNTTVIGYQFASGIPETQRIINNESYEIYATHGSFPSLIEYNAIIDDNNGGYDPVYPENSDPLIYYANTTSKDNVKLVANNCWEINGGSFVHADDLYPSGAFISVPTWNPGLGGAPKEGAALLYETATTQMEADEYSSAQTTLETIITDYPENDLADASVKELFSLERLLDNDYISFKSYLENNININSDSSLMILADFLINKCDVELEEWQEAVEHYETTIENPQTFEDSIFAIIDLGHLYFLMENGSNKSAKAITKYPEYQFEERKEFVENRNYLLSLLPNKNGASEQKETSSDKNSLSKNIPNPFSNKTSIEVDLEKASSISIKIIDLNGKMIQNHQFEKGEGLHQIPVNMTNEPSGIYYYSLFVDGVYVESNKMLLIK